MSVPAEKLVPRPPDAVLSRVGVASDRRADIDEKQARLAALLKEADCEGLVVLEPENFAWLTSGGAARGILDRAERPALYFSPEQRWVLSSNVDSQRLFDEEIDGLGFQLKEWPWHWGRDQLLADLCQGRKVGCDRPFGECKPLGDALRRLRRSLTAYEQAGLRSLGRILAHSLEATCRTMAQNQTERETAGQVSHRLLHRGAHPVVIGVAADGRSRPYRQFGFTETPIRRSCVLTATARKYGLCATASRALCFGPPDDAFRLENEAVCKISATYVASTWPDAVPREILTAGRRIYQLCGFEHEWLYCPQGHVTGRETVELALTPQTEELFQNHWAVTWRVSVGAACSCDTFLIAEKGPEAVTPTEIWPLSRIRVQGADFFRPYFLQR
jgi:Xaa-Pro aminopeptidase